MIDGASVTLLFDEET